MCTLARRLVDQLLTGGIVVAIGFTRGVGLSSRLASGNGRTTPRGKISAKLMPRVVVGRRKAEVGDLAWCAGRRTGRTNLRAQRVRNDG